MVAGTKSRWLVNRPALALCLATALAFESTIADARTIEIQSIVPGEGRAGSELTITGRGFASDNTVYFGSIAVAHVRIAASAGITCVMGSACRGGIIQTLRVRVPKALPSGPCTVVVKNVSGSSN